MKTIGLIGGMSWESTVTYYQIVNKTMKKELGGLHSAKVLLYSVDFAEIEEYQAKGEWDQSAEVLAEAAVNLEKEGAQGVILGCTEIGLLIQQKDTKLPVVDTTQIHATKAAMMAIE